MAEEGDSFSGNVKSLNRIVPRSVGVELRALPFPRRIDALEDRVRAEQAEERAAHAVEGEGADRDQRQDDLREGESHIGRAHQQVVQPTARVRGHEADPDALAAAVERYQVELRDSYEGIDDGPFDRIRRICPELKDR